MPDSYSQIHIQLVFAVKYRAAQIATDWKGELHKVITSLVQSRKHKMLQINSMPDHIHLLIGLRPVEAISSLVQFVKSESTKWVNEGKHCRSKFLWQEGYGAFSYSHSDLPKVIAYIQNQESHHKKKSFLDEYRDFLQAFEIEYKEEYIFKTPE